jgi:hypothetical protein
VPHCRSAACVQDPFPQDVALAPRFSTRRSAARSRANWRVAVSVSPAAANDQRSTRSCRGAAALPRAPDVGTSVAFTPAVGRRCVQGVPLAPASGHSQDPKPIRPCGLLRWTGVARRQRHPPSLGGHGASVGGGGEVRRGGWPGSCHPLSRCLDRTSGNRHRRAIRRHGCRKSRQAGAHDRPLADADPRTSRSAAVPPPMLAAFFSPTSTGRPDQVRRWARWSAKSAGCDSRG